MFDDQDVTDIQEENEQDEYDSTGDKQQESNQFDDIPFLKVNSLNVITKNAGHVQSYQGPSSPLEETLK